MVHIVAGFCQQPQSSAQVYVTHEGVAVCTTAAEQTIETRAVVEALFLALPLSFSLVSLFLSPRLSLSLSLHRGTTRVL